MRCDLALRHPNRRWSAFVGYQEVSGTPAEQPLCHRIVPIRLGRNQWFASSQANSENPPTKLADAAFFRDSLDVEGLMKCDEMEVRHLVSAYPSPSVISA
jgi:hypothetical protein